MDIVLKEKWFKLDAYGTEVKFRKPFGLEKQEILNLLAEISTDYAGENPEERAEKLTNELLSKLESLGLPRDVFLNMYTEDQTQIYNLLLDVKKN